MSERYKTLMESGRAALNSEDFTTARRAFEAAASIRIGDPVSRALLADSCLREGDKTGARDALNDVLILRPGDVSVLLALGKLELETGTSERGAELSQAAAAALKQQMWRRASTLISAPKRMFAAFIGRFSGKWPDIRTGWLCERAAVALADRRLPEAEGLLRRAEQRAASHPNVLYLRAMLLSAVGERYMALDTLREAAAARTDDLRIESAMIVVLARVGQIEEARARLDALPESARNSQDGKLAEAFTRWAQGQFDEARNIFSELIGNEPENGKILYALALLQAVLGNFEGAREGFRCAAAAAPRMGTVLWSATLSRCMEKDDELFESARSLTRDAEASQLDRGLAEMAIGRALIRTGENALGFTHLKQGNTLIEMEYDPVEQETRIDTLIRTFPRAFFEERKFSDRGDGRIFIVGLPRCGSTLVERILASHPMVFGAGETNQFVNLAWKLEQKGGYPEGIATVDQAELDHIAEEYLAAVTSVSGGEPFVIDKNLYNLHHLGLIALVLLKAKVIHCRRNIMDNGFSLYSHQLNRTYPYANDLRNIGHYYGQYRRLMRHWIDVLPIPILEIDYEMLTDNPESEIRKLLDFAGLPFDKACLRSHESKQIVETSSLAQVRQPINRRSVGSWRKFATELEPLREAVEHLDLDHIP